MSTAQSSPAPAPRRRLPAWTSNFGWQIAAALVLGLVLGLIARATGHTSEHPTWLGETLATVGSIYISLLKATVVPLVFFAVVASIANLAQVTNAARLAAKTLLWFAITSLIAVLIGLAVGVVLQPAPQEPRLILRQLAVEHRRQLLAVVQLELVRVGAELKGIDVVGRAHRVTRSTSRSLSIRGLSSRSIASRARKIRDRTVPIGQPMRSAISS